MEEFFSILQLLVREPSVVGTEDSFFRVLRRELEEFDEFEIKVEYYQGVLVARGKDPESLILSAHIDRHGLLCTGLNEFQYAAFIATNRSELTGDSISEQLLENIQDRFYGQRVQAHLPYAGTYLGQGVIQHSYLCPHRRNLIFEVSGLDFVPPGTPVSFLDRLTLGSDTISAQLDNVLSAAILIYLFRKGFQGTVLFTAQEEAGRSWRYALEWFLRNQIQTQRLIVLDTSPYPNEETVRQQQIVLRRRDANGYFAAEMTRELQERCDHLGILYSFKDDYVAAQNAKLGPEEKPISLGRTELGRLVAASEGTISGTTLQIPTTGYHTANETATIASVHGALRLLESYLQ